ncbi:MAG: exopolyphosphatase [Bacteroidia bacterium]
MRIAILDLGTNTFNLLIAEVKNKQADVLLKTKIPVKLGKDGLGKNIISPDAFERGINALTEHQKTIKEYKCEKTYAFATSAIRSTTNGAEFVAQVKQNLGIKINVISGDKEAEYIYEGVKQAIEIPSNSCIMNIGGGSTEFIICNREEILWKKSYQLGVSRLYELLTPHDPLTQECIVKAEEYINAKLEDLYQNLKSYNVTSLIGSSGSFDTFFDVIAMRKNLTKRDNPWEEISFEYFKEIHQDFIRYNLQQRLAMPGMIEMRADMMPIASILVNEVLKHHFFKKLYVSHYALKEGVLEDIAKQL